MKFYGIDDYSLRLLHRLKIISAQHTFDVFFEALENVIRVDRPEADQYQYREIKEHELEHLKLEKGIFPVEDIRRHFEQGLRFFATLKGETIIALNGAHERIANLSYIRRPAVPLFPGWVYLNCAVTAEAYRQRGIAQRLRSFISAQLMQEGFRNAVLVSFIHEAAAKSWHLSQGFKPWGRISYICFAKKDFWWIRLTNFGRQYPDLLNVTKNQPLTAAVEAIP